MKPARHHLIFMTCTPECELAKLKDQKTIFRFAKAYTIGFILMLASIYMRCSVTFVGIQLSIEGCRSSTLREATRYGTLADIRVLLEHLFAGIALVPLLSVLALALLLSIPPARRTVMSTHLKNSFTINFIAASRLVSGIGYIIVALCYECLHFNGADSGWPYQIAQMATDLMGALLGMHLCHSLFREKH